MTDISVATARIVAEVAKLAKVIAHLCWTAGSATLLSVKTEEIRVAGLAEHESAGLLGEVSEDHRAKLEREAAEMVLGGWLRGGSVLFEILLVEHLPSDCVLRHLSDRVQCIGLEVEAMETNVHLLECLIQILEAIEQLLRVLW